MRPEVTEAKMRSWANMMKERIDSGLTIEEWCEDNGINLKQFEYRRRKLRVYMIDHPTFDLSSPSESKLVALQTNTIEQSNICTEYKPAIINEPIEESSTVATITLNGITIQLTNNVSDKLIEQIRRLMQC